MNFNFDWFLNPILNHYADFEGRVGRQEYWMFVLYWVLISIGLALLGMIIGERTVELIHTIGTLAILVPSVALAARRLHDTNKSGWWQLVGLIPFLGWIILIFLLAQPSDAGENQFGPAAGASNVNPKNVSATGQMPPAAPSSTENMSVGSNNHTDSR